MGPTWPFLLMFKSRVERHSFCVIETLNGYCILRVDRLSTDPQVGASQGHTKVIFPVRLRFPHLVLSKNGKIEVQTWKDLRSFASK